MDCKAAPTLGYALYNTLCWAQSGGDHQEVIYLHLLTSRIKVHVATSRTPKKQTSHPHSFSGEQ